METTLLEIKIIAHWALQLIRYYRINHSEIEDRVIETMQNEARRIENLKQTSPLLKILRSLTEVIIKCQKSCGACECVKHIK